MTNDSAAAIRQDRRDWMARHREAYLRSGGTQGHIEDLTDVGGHAFTTHCLIRVAGRTSGKTYILPLIYGDIGGEVVIVASKGGADKHPDWYLNLRAAEHVDVQIATQAFRATWREPEGDERHRVWDFMVHVYPPYINYQKATTRHIPVIMLSPVKPIDVFAESDLQSS
ncbi:nitroreductase family deazaflavin-dependent oxidoreductase [Mycolicibacterium moriokaense]|nr:nitroreductase family deazaflavin-dependent oxidoreductase [Mycolicibacterium moriokaense]